MKKQCPKCGQNVKVKVFCSMNIVNLYCDRDGIFQERIYS